MGKYLMMGNTALEVIDLLEAGKVEVSICPWSSRLVPVMNPCVCIIQN